MVADPYPSDIVVSGLSGIVTTESAGAGGGTRSKSSPDSVVLAVKGDRVEVVIDAGREARTYNVVATRAGRRVDIRTGRSVVEVSELTRSGTPVRTARFMASRILALVEHPAGSGAVDVTATFERPDSASRRYDVQANSQPA